MAGEFSSRNLSVWNNTNETTAENIKILNRTKLLLSGKAFRKD